MNKQEMIQELRQRKDALEHTIDQCHDAMESMMNKAGGYSVEKFTNTSAKLRVAQCSLRAVKSRLQRLESGNPGPALPMYSPVNISNLQNYIKR